MLHSDQYTSARNDMVEAQIKARGVSDPLVLDAMRSVERHRFVPEDLRDLSYADGPLDIGRGQRISQPYIVAYMTEVAQLTKSSCVLDVGTGSRYQTAVLAEICDAVYTMEIIQELGERSSSLLKELGYTNIHARIGDGYQGWQEKAPFDAIILSAAPVHIPLPLVEQLKMGGRMIIPVGVADDQKLILITRTEDGHEEKCLLGVRFVPMTGEAER